MIIHLDSLRYEYDYKKFYQSGNQHKITQDTVVIHKKYNKVTAQEFTASYINLLTENINNRYQTNLEFS